MVNPRTLVAAPQRRPYQGGLLSVANVIDSADPHIAQGVEYDSLACAMPVPAPGLCWSTITFADGTTKDDVSAPVTTQAQMTFALYAAVECFAYAGDDYDQQARDLLTNGETVGVEAAFYDQYLSKLTPVTAPSANVVSAVGLAEQLLGAQYPGLGLIHMNRYVTNLAASAFVVGGGLTAQETPVANGAGYVDALTALAVTEQSELFATGQVTIWRSPIQVTKVTEPTLNTTLAIAERIYSLSVDCFDLAVNFGA